MGYHVGTYNATGGNEKMWVMMHMSEIISQLTTCICTYVCFLLRQRSINSNRT